MTKHIKLVDSVQPAYEQLEVAIKTNDLICVTGPPSVGKTTLVKLAFERNPKILSAFITCHDITSGVQFYSRICSKFQSIMNICRKDKAGNLIGSYKVNQSVNEPDFPQYCEEYCKYAKKIGVDKLFVVIDQFELMRRTQLLDSVAILLTISNICVIIVTNRSPTNIIDYLNQYSTRIGLIAKDRMLPIFVRNWSRTDIINAILEHEPRRDFELYKKFVQNIVNILYVDNTRNYQEIKIYCRENFPDFLKFFEKNLNNFDHFDGDQSNNFLSINNRDLSNLTSTFLQSLKMTIKKKSVSSWRSEGIESKLTHNGAFLIIAAYIAAHTNPTDDKKNFSVFSRSKSRRGIRNDDNSDSARAFTMERLIHIYLALMRSVLGEKDQLSLICNNDSVLSDIENFENIGILHILAGDGFSSDTRYKLSTCIRKQDIRNIGEKYEFVERFESILGSR